MPLFNKLLLMAYLCVITPVFIAMCVREARYWRGHKAVPNDAE